MNCKLYDFFRCPNGIFSYAGVKDKRGKTSQRVSVKRVQPQQISGSVKHNKSIQVGNFTFHQQPLTLGDAAGNHFCIVLR